jgi:hypothetical protein
MLTLRMLRAALIRFFFLELGTVECRSHLKCQFLFSVNGNMYRSVGTRTSVQQCLVLLIGPLQQVLHRKCTHEWMLECPSAIFYLQQTLYLMQIRHEIIGRLNWQGNIYNCEGSSCGLFNPEDNRDYIKAPTVLHMNDLQVQATATGLALLFSWPLSWYFVQGVKRAEKDDGVDFIVLLGSASL